MPHGDMEQGPFKQETEWDVLCKSKSNKELQQVPVADASRTTCPSSLKHKTDPCAVPRANKTQATAATFVKYVFFVKLARAVILIE